VLDESNVVYALSANMIYQKSFLDLVEIKGIGNKSNKGLKVFLHKGEIEIIAMTNPIIQTDIADILNRLDRKLDSLEDKFEQKFNRIDERLSNIEVAQAEIKGDLKTLDERLSGQIKNTDEKLSGQIKNTDEKLSGQIKNTDEKLSGQIKNTDEKLSGQIKNTDEKLSGQIKILDEKVSGQKEASDTKTDQLEKRINNQEFFTRIIGGSLVISILGGIVGFFWMFTKLR
jgi:hypothetical protein